VVPQMLYVVGQAIGAGAGVGLHALGAARRSLRVVLISSAITSVFTLIGALAAGVNGAVIGMAIGAGVSSLLTWWQFRMAFREYNAAAAAEWLQP
jgi:hypothetical protein